MESLFELARKKYRPEPIKCLFIAEAPPAVDSKRFFYFENVSKADTLYLETMKALFPSVLAELSKKQITKRLRSHKKYFLSKFCGNGFYLDDASKTPMPPEPTTSVKRRLIKHELPGLIDRLIPFIKPQTPIILISNAVHKVCFIPLKKINLNILNASSIPFPVGSQQRYKIAITEYLLKANLYPFN